MNRFPTWKYALIGLVIAAAFLYTLPNFFGESPAVQVSSAKSTVKVDFGLLGRVEQALQAANVAYTGTVVDVIGVRVRFADTDTQLRAKDVIDRALNPDRRALAFNGSRGRGRPGTELGIGRLAIRHIILNRQLSDLARVQRLIVLNEGDAIDLARGVVNLHAFTQTIDRDSDRGNAQIARIGDLHLLFEEPGLRVQLRRAGIQRHAVDHRESGRVGQSVARPTHEGGVGRRIGVGDGKQSERRVGLARHVHAILAPLIAQLPGAKGAEVEVGALAGIAHQIGQLAGCGRPLYGQGRSVGERWAAFTGDLHAQRMIAQGEVRSRQGDTGPIGAHRIAIQTPLVIKGPNSARHEVEVGILTLTNFQVAQSGGGGDWLHRQGYGMAGRTALAAQDDFYHVITGG